VGRSLLRKTGAPGAISYDTFAPPFSPSSETTWTRELSPRRLHQRKLGLGRGTEFSLRVQLPWGRTPAWISFSTISSARRGPWRRSASPWPSRRRFRCRRPRVRAESAIIGAPRHRFRPAGPAVQRRNEHGDLQPGASAPDFKLKNYDGTEISLSQYRGKKSVLLAFFPWPSRPSAPARFRPTGTTWRASSPWTASPSPSASPPSRPTGPGWTAWAA